MADDNGQPFIYNQSAAREKAQLFGGIPEKFGKGYTTSKVKMIQFDKKILNQLVVEKARKKIAYEYVKNRELTLPQDMFICYGNVFDEILEESKIPTEIVDELKALSVFCVEMDYVQFL